MAFGKKKVAEKEPAEPVEQKPDLVVDNPEVPDVQEEVSTDKVQPAPGYVGVPGFTPDKPATSAAPVAPAAKPVPEPQVKEQYQIISAELVGEGLYRYTVVCNKSIGEVGEIYDF